MCEAGECMERPPPCLPHPSVTPVNLTCLCNLTGLTETPEICQSGQLCDTACLTPVYCPDPTTQDGWAAHKAKVNNLTAANANETFIQWSWLEVECLEHTFTAEGEGGFQVKCGEDKTWNMTSCTFPVCTEVKVDKRTVEVAELLIIDKANTQGAILRFSCKDEAAVFNVGSGLTRFQANCNRR